MPDYGLDLEFGMFPSPGYDAFVFVTPEDNHGIPGQLKNARDFVKAERNDKGGGHRPLWQQLRIPRRRAAPSSSSRSIRSLRQT